MYKKTVHDALSHKHSNTKHTMQLPVHTKPLAMSLDSKDSKVSFIVFTQ
jgi:hypothetical protein